MTNFSLIFAASILNGCTFMMKDDQVTKCYGIDRSCGSEYFDQSLDRQQQVYQAEKSFCRLQKAINEVKL